MLSEKEEKILAESSLLAHGASSVFKVFSNADLPYPEIELSDGNTITLNKPGYSRYRTVTNRKDREAVFGAFWGAFDKFKAAA